MINRMRWDVTVKLRVVFEILGPGTRDHGTTGKSLKLLVRKGRKERKGSQKQLHRFRGSAQARSHESGVLPLSHPVGDRFRTR